MKQREKTDWNKSEELYNWVSKLILNVNCRFVVVVVVIVILIFVNTFLWINFVDV